jgi:hypothetical protein
MPTCNGRAGPSGLTFGVKHLPEFAEGLANALQLARVLWLARRLRPETLR